MTTELAAATTDGHFHFLDRGRIVPTATHWPPGPAYVNIAVSADVPVSVRRGATLVYYVTLTNAGRLDYRLDPCPDYNEFVGNKDVMANFQLNCGPVGQIAPGASVTFQMQLSIPTTTRTGQTSLTWALADGRLGMPNGVVHASLTVTG